MGLFDQIDKARSASEHRPSDWLTLGHPYRLFSWIWDSALLNREPSCMLLAHVPLLGIPLPVKDMGRLLLGADLAMRSRAFPMNGP